MHPHPSQLGLNEDSESTLPAAPHPGVGMLRGGHGQEPKLPPATRSPRRAGPLSHSLGIIWAQKPSRPQFWVMWGPPGVLSARGTEVSSSTRGSHQRDHDALGDGGRGRVAGPRGCPCRCPCGCPRSLQALGRCLRPARSEGSTDLLGHPGHLGLETPAAQPFPVGDTFRANEIPPR